MTTVSNRCPEFIDRPLLTDLQCRDQLQQDALVIVKQLRTGQPGAFPQFCCADLLSWHKTLYTWLAILGKRDDIAAYDYYPGNFRQVDAGRPCLAQGVRFGIRLGEHPAQVIATMSLFESWIVQFVTHQLKLHTNLSDDEKSINTIFIALEVAYQFLRVHPFLNGNGHISRCIVSRILYLMNLKPLSSIDPGPSFWHQLMIVRDLNGPVAAVTLFVSELKAGRL